MGLLWGGALRRRGGTSENARASGHFHRFEERRGLRLLFFGLGGLLGLLGGLLLGLGGGLLFLLLGLRFRLGGGLRAGGGRHGGAGVGSGERGSGEQGGDQGGDELVHGKGPFRL